MNKHYDIIIIGAGLVGTSLAVALANTHLQIALIEAAPERSLDPSDPAGRCIVLSPATNAIFTTLNIWSQLEEFVTPITTIHISDKGHFGATRVRAHEMKCDVLGYSIPAVAIAATLQQKLAHATNLTLIQPAMVSAINGNSLTVNEQELSATLIIAADGANSTTLTKLGITSTTTDYNQSAVVTNVTCSQPHQNIAYERFTTEGPIALLPIDRDAKPANQRMTLVWTTTHEHAKTLAALSDAEFLKQLQQTFGYRAGGFTALTKRTCYPLNLTISDKQFREGILVLGNAAHALHPVSAQGFNLGLRDVAQLAETLLQAPVETIGDSAVLSAYVAARAEDQQTTIQYTDDLIRIFSNDALLITPLRSCGLSLLNALPLLKNHITHRAMGFRGRASRLLRGLKLS